MTLRPTKALLLCVSAPAKPPKTFFHDYFVNIRELREAEARETAHDQFIKQESDFDQFLEGANLTRDSYAGRGELEAESPTVVDVWGNVQG